MTPDDIGVLLRIKRAREEAAEVALRQAHAAQSRAARARGRAEQAATDFVAERRVQEAAIYRSLTTGPIPAQKLRQAAAQLSGITAYAEVLAQRAAQAVRHEAACAETSGTAQRAHARAVRDSLGVTTLHQRLDAAARAGQEQSRDAELEELAALGDPTTPDRVPS